MVSGVSTRWGAISHFDGWSAQVGLSVEVLPVTNQTRVFYRVWAVLRCVDGSIPHVSRYVHLSVGDHYSKTFHTDLHHRIYAGEIVSLIKEPLVYVEDRELYAQVFPISVKLADFPSPGKSMRASLDFTIPQLAGFRPSAPQVSVTRVNDTSARVSWKPDPYSDSPIDMYRVERLVNNGGWVQVAELGSATSGWVDGGIPGAGHSLKWRVRAEGPGGESDWAITPVFYTRPLNPESVTGGRSGSNVVLSWDYKGFASPQFEVWRDGVRIGVTAEGASSYTDVDVDTTQLHVYSVRAVIDGLVSDKVSTGTISLFDSPLAPRNLSPNGEWRALGSRGERLSWSHVPVDGTAQSRFRLRWRASETAEWESIERETANSFTLFGEIKSERVEWQVSTTGQDESKWSPWSESAVIYAQKRPSVSVIESPVGHGGVHGSNSLTITFGSDVVGTHSYRARLFDYTNQLTHKPIDGVIDNELSQVSLTFSDLEDGVRYGVHFNVTDRVPSFTKIINFRVEYPTPALPESQASWDPVLGVVTLIVTAGEDTDGASPVTDFLRLERQVEGKWVLWHDNLVSGTTVTDMKADGVGSNLYRLTAVSNLGVSIDKTIEVDTRGNPLRAVVLSIPDVGQSVSLLWNPTQEQTLGLSAVRLHNMAGRVKPLMFTGTHQYRTIHVGATVPLDEAEVTLAGVRSIVLAGVPVLYRDPSGVRLWGAVENVLFTFDRVKRCYQVGFKVTEVANDE